MLTESVSGNVGGQGTGGIPGGPPDTFGLSGRRSASSIELTMTVPGFESFTFSGVYDGTAMDGVINGSGFERFSTHFTRVPAGPANGAGSVPRRPLPDATPRR
jgi:hypothetical protein